MDTLERAEDQFVDDGGSSPAIPKRRLFTDRETLRLRSGRIIAFFGDLWGPLGWALFLFRFSGPWMLMNSPNATLICVLLRVAMCAWWIVDNLDQESRTWLFIAGPVVFAFYPINSPTHWLPPTGFWLYYYMSMRKV